VAGNIGRHNTEMPSDEEALEQVILWINIERHYTLEKFSSIEDRTHIVEWQLADYLDDEEIQWWDRQLENYLYRARVLGLDTPNGRQALAKFVSTAVGMLSATVQQFGPLPKAGLPSGEIQE